MTRIREEDCPQIPHRHSQPSPRPPILPHGSNIRDTRENLEDTDEMCKPGREPTLPLYLPLSGFDEAVG